MDSATAILDIQTIATEAIDAYVKHVALVTHAAERGYTPYPADIEKYAPLAHAASAGYLIIGALPSHDYNANRMSEMLRHTIASAKLDEAKPTYLDVLTRAAYTLSQVK
jgi:hypothetical protein